MSILAVPAVISLEIPAAAESNPSLAAEYGGLRRDIVVRIWNPWGPVQPFEVDQSKLRMRLVPLGGGPPITLRPSSATTVASGTPVRPTVYVNSLALSSPRYSVVDVHFPIAASVSPTMYEAYVLDAGGAVTSSGVSVSLFDGEHAAARVYVPGGGASDTGLRLARKQYVGESVYVRGGLAFSCDSLGADRSQHSLSNAVPVRIAGVERSSGEAAVWTLGGPMGERAHDAGASFIAIEPLIVHFAGRNVASISGSRGHLAACGNPSAAFSDLWEVQRFFTLQDPATLPGLTAKFRDALDQNDVLPGMTRDMIADTFGYPSLFGTVAQMNAEQKWYYAAPAPNQFTIFFAGQRVARYDPPGSMP